MYRALNSSCIYLWLWLWRQRTRPIRIEAEVSCVKNFLCDVAFKGATRNAEISWRRSKYEGDKNECLDGRVVSENDHDMPYGIKARAERDGTRAETRFCLSPKRTSPFKSVGASVQSTTGNRVLRISGSNAGYTMFRGSVKSTGYPLHSPVSPSLPLPCVIVCHHISTGLYLGYWSYCYKVYLGYHRRQFPVITFVTMITLVVIIIFITKIPIVLTVTVVTLATVVTLFIIAPY